ncbi:MAG TPA: LPXTG cell wall anchor domain-containing protein [Dongiaceae bacterium]|nr:LPXTG cell wall anchor domain-containing protein [Dongiaceae bacterium]
MAVRITRAGVGLTIGIIVLAGAVLAGVLIMKQRGEVARNDATMKIAEQKLKDESNQGVALNQGSNSQNSSQSSGNSSDNGSTNSSNSSNNAASNTGNSSASAANGGSNGSSAAELPQTGPENAFAPIIVALLVFVGASYWRSRRTLLEAS